MGRIRSSVVGENMDYGVKAVWVQNQICCRRPEGEKSSYDLHFTNGKSEA